MRRSRASSADLSPEHRRDSTGPPRTGSAGHGESTYVEVTVTTSPAAADLVSTLLFESGATAIAVTEGAWPRLRTHLPDDPALQAHLARVRRYLTSLRSCGCDPGPAKVRTRRVYDRGWAVRWKQFFRPVRIGRRLVITPSWERAPVKEGDIIVELDPGMAFGTGQHATTRMCLELLEEAFEQFGARNDRGPRTVDRQLSAVNRRPSAIRRQPAVLDLGTGSGLLAIAALRFGAGRVLALDTDTVACRTASENIRRNGGDGRIIVKHGSLEAAGRRTHDVVLANLTAEQLISLAPRLTRSLRSKGRLIASGILRHQERRVAETFRGCGLVVERVRRGREWVGLMSRRASASPRGAR